MKYKKLINGVYTDIDESQLINGDRIKKEVAVGVWAEMHYSATVINKVYTDIVITGITGALQHSQDFSKVACYQNTDIVISGTSNVEDRFFVIPIQMISTGELVFFGAEVVNKSFNIVINFERSGQYQYTNIQANLDLPEDLYNVLPMKFDVLRKLV